MEETLENVKEASWDEVGADKGVYFSPERDKAYTITVASARLVKDEKYKDKDGKPKLKCIMKLATIDRQKTDLKWTTGSWSIMREIKKVLPVYGDDSLTRSTFLLKMKEEQGKRTYIFEKTGELSSPSLSGPEAFL